jgi:hypothetical protein
MITDNQITHLQASIKDALTKAFSDKDTFALCFFQLHTQQDLSLHIEMYKNCLDFTENKLKQDNDILSDKNELLCLVSILTILKTDTSFYEENKNTFSVIDIALLKYAKSLIDLDKVDFENGFVPMLRYFGNFDFNTQELNQLLAILQEYLSWAKNENFEWSFYRGKSGLLVTLINLLYKNNSTKRIYIDVSEMEAFVATQVEKITHSILPVGEVTDLVTFFPTVFNDDDDILTISNKMTWGEGDLNQVITLYKAGCIFDNQTYCKIADRVGTYTLIRTSFEDNEVDSIFLENGSSGLALTYLSLYKGTKNEKYLEGYHFWKNRTLSSLKENFETLKNDMNNTHFMSGLLGVMLALDVFENNQKTLWMKLLLL